MAGFRAALSAALAAAALSATAGHMPKLFHPAVLDLRGTDLSLGAEVYTSDSLRGGSLIAFGPGPSLHGAVIDAETGGRWTTEGNRIEPTRVFVTGRGGAFRLSGGIGVAQEWVRFLRYDQVPYKGEMGNTGVRREEMCIDLYNRTTVSAFVGAAANVAPAIRSLLCGVELDFVLPRGFTYHEKIDHDDGVVTLTYRKLSEPVYACRAALGVRDTVVSRRNRLLSRVGSLNYNLVRDYSLPRQVENIEPFLEYGDLKIPPTVRFCGVDAAVHTISLRSSLADLHHELVTLTRGFTDGFFKSQFELEELTAVLRATAVRADTTMVNRWEREGLYYWGATSRQRRVNRLALDGTSAKRVYFFERFYLRSRITGSIEAEHAAGHVLLHGWAEGELGLGMKVVSRKGIIVDGGLRTTLGRASVGFDLESDHASLQGGHYAGTGTSGLYLTVARTAWCRR